MDLDFNDEQNMLRDMVRRVCEEHSTVDVVRQLEDDPKGYPDSLWKQLGELGILGLTLPEEHGGSGQGLLEACVVYEELGRALAPSPHLVSSVLAAGAIAAAGTDAQKAEWLPKIAAGEAILSPAWLEPDNGYGPRGVQVRAESNGDGWVLSGTKRHVAFASSAERLLVLARTGDDGKSGGITLLLVDPTAAGVSLEQQRTLASDCQYQVTFDGVKVPRADAVGEPGTGWATWHAVMLDAIVLVAAQAMGGAQKALEITVDYAKVREQFDKPIGAFQAIAHYLADCATWIEGGRTLVHEAAWARSVGRSTAQLAPMAKLHACRTYRDVTAKCEQVHGGIGFTIEHDIQLYFRRAKQLQVSWWDDRYLEELIASEVLDS